MRWLLTSDWQSKFSNLDACKRAHQQELDIIERHKIEGHIDLGDLKDDFNPVDVDVVQFQQERKERIHDAVIYDITLLGNHDMLGQYTAEKNWFSLFDSISGHNVKVPCTLALGNCVFSCLPFRRSQSLLIKQADALYKKQLATQAKRHILLFHCDVANAKYSYATSKKSEAKLSVKDLHTDFYDMCFGGHIHLYQKLTKNTLYVGNPFATDNGEINQQKGFLIYDDETNEIKRVLSKVPGIFSWQYVQKHKPNLVDGTKIKDVVDCKPEQDYHKLLDKTASTIEKKYPNCIAYVVPRFDSVDKKTTIEVDPDSNDYDKIRSYIAATLPMDLQKKRKALAHYISSILTNATGSGVRQSGKIIFDSVSAQNVLTFQKLNFSYRHRGLMLVRGKNKDSPWNSNGAGKSNMLSMIPIACFGRTFKKQQNDGWANDSNTDKAKVELTILDENKRKLHIIRGRRPVRLKFEINGEDVSRGRRHKGKRETQGVIEETIGYTFETLANSVYLDQSLQNAFLTGTGAERAKLIHQFQNMDRFKLARDLVTKELSLVSKNIDVLENERSIADALVQQAKIDIKHSKQQNKDNIKRLTAEYREVKASLRTSRITLKNLKEVYHKKEHSISKATKELEKTLDGLEKELSLLEGQREAKQSELDSFKDLGQAKKCPVCYKDLTDKEKQILVARFTKAIGAKKTEIKKREVAIVSIQEKIEAYNAPLDSLRKELDETSRSVEKISDKRDFAKEKLNEAKHESKQDKSADNKLVVRSKKLKNNIVRIDRSLAHLAEDKKFLGYAQDSMSRDGLPAFLNKLLCPLLNKAASKYSEIFIDKEIQVLFEIEDGQIVPKIVNLHGAKSIEGQSTGEKAWAGIITSFALREIAHPTNLLILDEPGHGLDVESAKMFGSRLCKLKERFETILIVSHNPAIISALDGDKSITVVKQNKISTIV